MVKVLTIEYDGKSPEDFFSELKDMKPKLVIDIRFDPKHAVPVAYDLNHVDEMVHKIYGADYISIPELSYSKYEEVIPKCRDFWVGFGKALYCIFQWKRSTVVLLSDGKDEEKPHLTEVKNKLEKLLSPFTICYSKDHFHHRMALEVEKAEITQEEKATVFALLDKDLLFDMLQKADMLPFSE